MKKVALISCAKYKLDYLKSEYDNDVEYKIFNLSYDYAKKVADEIYILSARYGLLKEGEYLSTYNETLDYKSEVEMKLWAMNILEKLSEYTDIHNDVFIILAPKNYYKYYIKYLNNVTVPLENMTNIEAIEFLKSKENIVDDEGLSYGEKLHFLFNNMKVYTYKDLDDIPFTNGIYVILDKYEKYNAMKRIVRIGSHEGENRLIIRLKKHFKDGAKDESIIRKNIGRAILYYNKNDYLSVWNINYSDRRNQVKYNHLRNMELENKLERLISYYMIERFEIVCFEVMETKERVRLEEGLISTLIKDENFKSSKKWLGNYSPMEVVRESGMWIKKGVINKEFTSNEFREVITLCIKSEEEVNS